MVSLHRPLTAWQLFVVLVAALFLLQQAATPIRNLMYDGDVAWHEYGHLFSWRMKLRDKQCYGNFTVDSLLPADPAHRAPPRARLPSQDPSRQRFLACPSEFLTKRQWTKLKSRPDLLLQFGHAVGRHYKQKGLNGVRVFADVRCQLNFRPTQQFTDPSVDLMRVTQWAWPYAFVVPLEPFPEPYLEDFPWHMSLQRFLDIVTMNRHISDNHREEQHPLELTDYFGHLPPYKGDDRQHVENRTQREPQIFGSPLYNYQLEHNSNKLN